MNKRIEKKISRKGISKEYRAFFNNMNKYKEIEKKLKKSNVNVLGLNIHDIQITAKDVVKLSNVCLEKPLDSGEDYEGGVKCYGFKFEGIYYFALFDLTEQMRYFPEEFQKDFIEINGVKYKKAD
ncbi:hypothetical protein CKN96_15790 [Carnobacterium maltaromaticum]|uniref:hypothetical protein n=1 Tax=Carnobacterium maltaromaticum TaxID=2751 RepID=UPI001073C34C|nr:hypothetical protein [Carnobacterium maltaromaticum]TFJ56044.1 hypothetical protein CKN96_15790 [Carnobacterium maltaromaticum]